MHHSFAFGFQRLRVPDPEPSTSHADDMGVKVECAMFTRPQIWDLAVRPGSAGGRALGWAGLNKGTGRS
jgi:hypothetical protein